MKDLKGENKKFYKYELKKRKVWKYIRIRNLKQLIKKIIIAIKL